MAWKLLELKWNYLHNLHHFSVFMKCWMMCRFELWLGLTSCPFVEYGPVHPLLKKVIKEALKHISLVCKFQPEPAILQVMHSKQN